MRQRKRYFLHPVGARVKLFDSHAVVEGSDGDIVLTVLCSIINEGDDRGVKFVLNRKHEAQRDGIGRSPQGQVLERGGLFGIVWELMVKS